MLQRVAWPENLASHMFALLRVRPEFATTTTQLRMFTSTGRLVDAKVTWVRTIIAGPVPQCGYFVQPDRPERLILDGLAARRLDRRTQLPGQQRRLDGAGTF